MTVAHVTPRPDRFLAASADAPIVIDPPQTGTDPGLLPSDPQAQVVDRPDDDTTASRLALYGSVPIETVDSDSALTRCTRHHGQWRAWRAGNPWAPFRKPDVVRVWERQPPPPDAIDLDLRRDWPAGVRTPDGHGVGRRLLIVDDKVRYRRLTHDWFADARGFQVDVVVSDISMELELAGCYLAGKVHWLCGGAAGGGASRGYPGLYVLSSTGFDNWFGVMIASGVMSAYGVRWVIPKTSLVAGRARYIRCRAWW